MTRWLALPGLVMIWASVASSGEPVGWRTDGTGHYPGARPPLQWSRETNVTWTAPLPAWSNATPVLVDGRVLLCAEPDRLLCLTAEAGDILWERANSYADAVGPAEAERIRQATKALAEVNRKLRPLRKEHRELRKKLRKGKEEEGKGEDAGQDDQALKARYKQLNGRIRRLKTEASSLRPKARPSTHSVNGYTSSTPVSDGERVYVLFGTGVVACYDLEGARQWIRLVQKPTRGYGHSSSPALVGGRLIVHVNDLVALNPRTGRELWRAKASPRYGSPVGIRAGGRDIVLTANGEAVDAADGKVLAKGLAKLEYASPVVHGQVAYYIEHGGKAVRLPADGESTAFETLWTTKPKKDRYYASPVVHDGLIYAVTQHNVLSVIDASTGEVLHERKIELGKGTVYPSLALAGGHLFVSSDNGTTLVLEPGREPTKVELNTLEPFRSTPVFQGRCLYLRARKRLYRIGR